ncbi:MAG: DUF934 domain-containing protein [Pseudomonadota bacterium]
MRLLKFSGARLFPAVEEAQTETSLEEWRDNPQAHADATALVVPNDASIDDLGADASGFSTIILNFPAFKDGRAYSQARLLRDRFGYAGEIRARGDVLRDQLLFMRRCGFDAFEFAGANADEADAALEEFSFVYQSASDESAPVWRQRQSRAAAAA